MWVDKPSGRCQHATCEWRRTEAVKQGAHIDDENAARQDAIQGRVVVAAHAGARWCLAWRCHGPSRMRRRLRRVSWSSLLCAALLLCQLPLLLWWHMPCAVLSMLRGRVMVALCGFSKVLLGQSVREVAKFAGHHPFEHATLKGEV